MVRPMDPVDRAIVAALQHDGRRPQQQIADEVGLSQPAVAERIRKLERAGVIKGYAALVDGPKVGVDVTAFVGIVIEPPRHFDAFARHIRDLPEVLECHRVAGEFTYLLKVKTANTRTLDTLLTKRLRTLPGVTRSFTTMTLLSVKESAAVPLETSPEVDHE
jgi:Lrp/AsnC family transcriptional regulator, leucine-responsive regulatory protein